MAASGMIKRSTAGTAAAVLLVVLAAVAAALLVAPAAEASTLTAFAGPGCSGKSKDVNYVCGCYDITGYEGGYHFVFAEGQKAYLHRGCDCRDARPHQLHHEKRHCHHTGFKSVEMIC